MKVFKNMIPYLAGIVAVFYLLPLFMRNTGGAMMVMLFAMPALCVTISFSTAGTMDFTRSILWR